MDGIEKEVAIGSVLIIGCGYVGLPLAKAWIEKGLRVYGTTRKVEKGDLLKFQLWHGAGLTRCSTRQ